MLNPDFWLMLKSAVKKVPVSVVSFVHGDEGPVIATAPTLPNAPTPPNSISLAAVVVGVAPDENVVGDPVLVAPATWSSIDDAATPATSEMSTRISASWLPRLDVSEQFTSMIFWPPPVFGST